MSTCIEDHALTKSYYIPNRVRNTGIGSLNLWCGKHTYFEDNDLKKNHYIPNKVKNTGIGSLNLWCGKHYYFNDDGYKIEKKQKKKIIYDLITGEKITEYQDYNVIDLTL